MHMMKSALALAAVIVAAVLSSPANAEPSKIGIVVFDGFLTSDVTAPIEVFEAATKKPALASHQVVVISITRNKTVRSEEGLTIVADKTIFDDIKLDVLIVPSAYEMDGVLKNRDLIQFIRSQAQWASWLASNCSGAFLLGEAGVLDGKKATTWAGGEDDLAKAYPKIKVQHNTNVVVDDKIITSNGGPVSYQAAFRLLAKLSSQEFANEISQQVQFNRLAHAFKR